MRYLWITVICAAMRPCSLAAQALEGRDSPLVWEVWGALAQNSPGTLWGAEKGRDVAVVAVRAARVLASSPSVRLEYVMDLVPAAWVSMPRPAPRCGPLPPGERCTHYHAFEGSDAAWGAGAAPVGLQAEFRAARWAHPYLSVGTGLLYFSRPVPVENAGRVHFTADLGAGVRIAMPARWRASVGYKFYHISNGGTARQNPGLDGHMVVVGLQRTREPVPAPAPGRRSRRSTRGGWRTLIHIPASICSTARR
jgi:hypothetical protein